MQTCVQRIFRRKSYRPYHFKGYFDSWQKEWRMRIGFCNSCLENSEVKEYCSSISNLIFVCRRWIVELGNGKLLMIVRVRLLVCDYKAMWLRETFASSKACCEGDEFKLKSVRLQRYNWYNLTAGMKLFHGWSGGNDK